MPVRTDRHQDRGRDSYGTRRRYENGRRTHRQVHHSVAMAEKSREYKKKINKLEKGGKDKGSGESTTKNGTRGGVRASRKNKQSKTYQNPKFGPPPKSASQSAPRQQSILQSPSRGESQQAGAAEVVRQKKGKSKKQRAPRAHQGQHCGTRKPTAPNRAVGQRKGKGKLRLPSRRAQGYGSSFNKSQSRWPRSQGSVKIKLKT